MNGGTVQLAERIFLLLSCVFNPRNDAAVMEIRECAARDHTITDSYMYTTISTYCHWCGEQNRVRLFYGQKPNWVRPRPDFIVLYGYYYYYYYYHHFRIRIVMRFSTPTVLCIIYVYIILCISVCIIVRV